MRRATLLVLVGACAGGEATLDEAPVDDTDPDTGTTVDADHDGAPVPADCDDANPLVRPGSAESCNGVDDDCDGMLDADDARIAGATSCFVDLDVDGFGSEAARWFCTPPASGCAAVDGDCDDGDPNRRPDAPEVWYDGVDEACDGGDDDDQDGDGVKAAGRGGLDCRDTDPTTLDCVEILRPVGPGAVTDLPSKQPDTGGHWEKLAEEAADDGGTWVGSGAGNTLAWSSDLYALSEPIGPGPFTSVTVRVRVEDTAQAYGAGDIAAVVLRDAFGHEERVGVAVTTHWTTADVPLATSPFTGAAWTADELAELQAGVSLLDFSFYEVRASQLEVEVRSSLVP